MALWRHGVSVEGRSGGMSGSAPDAAPARHVVLIGVPGAGKSVTGRRLARRLARPFLDLDAELVRRRGRSVAAIFADEGEEGFRRHERELTRELAAADVAPSVIAPGGGWVLDPVNVAALRPSAIIVWLRVGPAEAVARMGARIARRPLLAGDDPVVALAALAERREAAYAAAADLVAETAGRRPEQVARWIAGMLARGVTGAPRT